MFRERPLTALQHELDLLVRSTKHCTFLRRVQPRPCFSDEHWHFTKLGLRVKVKHPAPSPMTQYCPFGLPGDHLWVREAFRLQPMHKIVYRQDDPTAFSQWQPALTLRRNYCRFILRVKRVHLGQLTTLRPQFPEITSAYLSSWDRYNPTFPARTNPWVWLIETVPVFS